MIIQKISTGLVQSFNQNIKNASPLKSDNISFKGDSSKYFSEAIDPKSSIFNAHDILALAGLETSYQRTGRRQTYDTFEYAISDKETDAELASKSDIYIFQDEDGEFRSEFLRNAVKFLYIKAYQEIAFLRGKITKLNNEKEDLEKRNAKLFSELQSLRAQNDSLRKGKAE